MVGRAIKLLTDDGLVEVNGKNIVVRGTRQPASIDSAIRQTTPTVRHPDWVAA